MTTAAPKQGEYSSAIGRAERRVETLLADPVALTTPVDTSRIHAIQLVAPGFRCNHHLQSLRH